MEAQCEIVIQRVFQNILTAEFRDLIIQELVYVIFIPFDLNLFKSTFPLLFEIRSDERRHVWNTLSVRE